MFGRFTKCTVGKKDTCVRFENFFGRLNNTFGMSRVRKNVRKVQKCSCNKSKMFSYVKGMFKNGRCVKTSLFRV